MESLRSQIAAHAGAAEALREASTRAEDFRTSLGDVGLDSLAAEIKALGADPAAGLESGDNIVKGGRSARAVSNQAATARTLAMSEREATLTGSWMQPSVLGI